MTHELKILEPFADAITNGEKTFEVRRNDRNFQKGDLVKFEVISAQTGNPITHKIDAQLFRIGYVLKFEDFPAGLSEGFAVFTITRAAKKWRETEEGYSTYYECPECGEGYSDEYGTPEQIGWQYCPECGARLEGICWLSKDDEQEAEP